MHTNTNLKDQYNWPWWPLLPLYPYSKRRTFVSEIIPSQVWSFEQLQGLYYVAVPIRLSVIRVKGGLMLFNPLPPTKELLEEISKIENKYGPVLSIVLPTSSGLEHKISLPSLARAFPKSKLWISSGQWSFPFDLPSSWLGLPPSRTKVLFDDGLPHSEDCTWHPLGPVNIGLGCFQEISCFHKPTKSLFVTDALVGISSIPPEIFDFDPTPLLFHSRDSGDELLEDSEIARRKGWARVVLFASFLRPSVLSIPTFRNIFKTILKPGVRNPKAHFGLYPFDWNTNWHNSAKDLLGVSKPKIQVPPVLERLVFPRAKKTFLDWLDKIEKIKGIQWLIPAHYSAPVSFKLKDIRDFKFKLSKGAWASSKGNWDFLDSVDKALLKRGIVPKDSYFID